MLSRLRKQLHACSHVEDSLRRQRPRNLNQFAKYISDEEERARKTPPWLIRAEPVFSGRNSEPASLPQGSGKQEAAGGLMGTSWVVPNYCRCTASCFGLRASQVPSNASVGGSMRDACGVVAAGAAGNLKASRPYKSMPSAAAVRNPALSQRGASQPCNRIMIVAVTAMSPTIWCNITGYLNTLIP